MLLPCLEGTHRTSLAPSPLHSVSQGQEMALEEAAPTPVMELLGVLLVSPLSPAQRASAECAGGPPRAALAGSGGRSLQLALLAPSPLLTLISSCLAHRHSLPPRSAQVFVQDRLICFRPRCAETGLGMSQFLKKPGGVWRDQSLAAPPSRLQLVFQWEELGSIIVEIKQEHKL